MGQLDFQKNFGLVTAACLVCSAVFQARGHPAANSVAALSLLANNTASLNRSIRRDMPMKFSIVLAEMVTLTLIATLPNSDKSLDWRFATTALAFLMDEPNHLNQLSNPKTAEHYNQRDREKINYLEEIQRLLSPASFKKSVQESINVLRYPPNKNADIHEKIAFTYAVALVATTLGSVLQIAGSDGLCEKILTALGITVANGISMQRSWNNEKNYMACIANVCSASGYMLMGNENISLALMTLSTALQSLAQCGFKGSKNPQSL